MTNQVLRVVLGGVLAGTLLYFFPFILPVIGIIFLIGFIFRLIAGPGHRRGWHYYNEKLKNMTAEERKEYFDKYGYGCYAKEREADLQTDTQKM